MFKLIPLGAAVRAPFAVVRFPRAGFHGQVPSLSALLASACCASAMAQVTPDAPNAPEPSEALPELSVSARRLMLQTFNTLPHLAAPEDAGLITHA